MPTSHQLIDKYRQMYCLNLLFSLLQLIVLFTLDLLFAVCRVEGKIETGYAFHTFTTKRKTNKII